MRCPPTSISSNSRANTCASQRRPVLTLVPPATARVRRTPPSRLRLYRRPRTERARTSCSFSSSSCSCSGSSSGSTRCDGGGEREGEEGRRGGKRDNRRSSYGTCIIGILGDPSIFRSWRDRAVSVFLSGVVRKTLIFFSYLKSQLTILCTAFRLLFTIGYFPVVPFSRGHVHAKM